MERELSFFQKVTLQFSIFTDTQVIQWVEAHRTAVSRSGGNIAVLTSMHELRNTPRRADAAAAAASKMSDSHSSSGNNSSSSSSNSGTKSRRSRSRSAVRGKGEKTTAAASSSSSHAKTFDKNEPCGAFNSKKGCVRANCWYKHVCLVQGCGQSHPGYQHR